METGSTILNELNGISPTVAKIGAANPYPVPAGYFEGLAARVLQRIRAEGLNLAPAGNLVLGETVPDGIDDATEELKLVSPLLSGLSRKMPYEVPAGYFGELTGNAIDGIKAIGFVEDELHSSALLNSLRKENVYAVPAGYFESLPSQILNRIKKQQPAKVIGFSSKRFMQYAAAAVLTGVMAIAGWIYFGKDDSNIQAVAGVEKISDDIKISDEELSNFIENESEPVVANNYTPANSDEMDEADVKEMLSELSDDELQQYLTTL